MEFYSYSNRPSVVACPEGDRMRPDKALVTDPKGNKRLEVVGETDQYAVIQSFREGTDLNALVEMYGVTKDVSVFQRKNGAVYGDATQLPKTLAEAHALLQKAEVAFASLPADKRNAYADYRAFFDSCGSVEGLNKFIHDVGFVKPAEEAPKKEDKPNE